METTIVYWDVYSFQSIGTCDPRPFCDLVSTLLKFDNPKSLNPKAPDLDRRGPIKDYCPSKGELFRGPSYLREVA